jgi:hypothetical protein
MKSKSRNRIVLTAEIPLDIPTSSGRVYAKAGMEKAVKNYLDSHKGKPMLGELNPDHKHSSFITRLFNVSHQITKLEVKDSSLLCQVLLLDTPVGKIVQDIYNETNKLRFEPRATFHYEDVIQEDGTVKQEMRIDNLVSIDIV